MSQVKTIIIGNGSIGSELQRQLEDLEWEIEAVVARESSWRELLADVVFLAIPSDGGESALEYIEHFLSRNIPVVTCEKGALSQHFEKLSPHLGKIGYSATVGGGTRMLKFLESRDRDKITSITGVLNGTLNFIFSKLGEGSTKEEVLKEVLEKKYAEPGADTFLDIIRGELGDLHKKSVIVANTSLLLETFLTPSADFEIPKNVLENALENPAKYRFLFFMSREKGDNFVAGVSYENPGWYVQAGLFDISRQGFPLPEGVLNGLFITEGENVEQIIGPGAGPTPTALAMLADAKELLT